MSASTARSLLFVPGDRPERFAKAAASGADLTIIDLEDAVPSVSKLVARDNATAWLIQNPGTAVRINAVGTPEFEADIAALHGREVTVILPKAESDEQVARLQNALPAAKIIGLVETARGVLDAVAIARSGVVRLALGNVDLSTELGVSPANRQALSYTRSTLVLASAAAGIASPIDGVTTDLQNHELVADDSRYSAEMGFSGKLCVHPAQVGVVNAAYAPSDAEIGWAQEVIDAVAAGGSPGGAIAMDGQMIDTPVVERASRILRRQ